MTAYYNENDPFAAAWLRELIKAGMIAPGDVDERSILDVNQDDLAGYDQCHFFAGIGTWSYSLRCAGWPDERPVWTGSPPCQPFSVAGKQLGKNDERHLAPHWLELIRQRRPAVVFGEQVDAAIRHGWLDDLQDALEAEGYAFGAVVLPACSVGAPHIRQRLWFVAERLGDAGEPGLEGHTRHGDGVSQSGWQQAQSDRPVAEAGSTGGVANNKVYGWGERHQNRRGFDEGNGEKRPLGRTSKRIKDGGMADAECNKQRERRAAGSEGEPRNESGPEPSRCCSVSRLADTTDNGHIACDGLRETTQPPVKTGTEDKRESSGGGDASATHTPDDFWRDADWLFCRDGKWRPVEPGTFPLVNGASARVGRLRGYGNGIVAPLAQAVIEAYLHE